MPSPRPRVNYKSTHLPKAYKEHKQFVALKLRHFKPFKRVALSVSIDCYFVPSKTADMNKYPVPKGDVDNYAKTYLDAMEGLIYENDTLVEELSVTKRYATSNAVFITVKEIVL